MPDIVLKPLYGDGPTLPFSIPVVLRGQQGASAYELAVEAGFGGSPADWLASLVGELSDADRELVRQAVETGARALDLGTRIEPRLDEVDAALSASARAAEATAQDRTAVEDAATAASRDAGSAFGAAELAQTAAREAGDERSAAADAANEAGNALFTFTSRWLGTHAGVLAGPQSDGALYFDSVTAQLMMWFGGAWQAVATAPSAVNLRDRLLTVDGTGSGIDADQLDGRHASDFARLVYHGYVTEAAFTIPVGISCLPLTNIYLDPAYVVDAGRVWSKTTRINTLHRVDVQVRSTALWGLNGSYPLRFLPTGWSSGTRDYLEVNLGANGTVPLVFYSGMTTLVDTVGGAAGQTVPAIYVLNNTGSPINVSAFAARNQRAAEISVWAVR